MSRDILAPEPYTLDDDFEQTAVVMACRSLRFWSRVGYELEPDLMPSKVAQLVMRTARMVAIDGSRAPSLVRVRQRLQTMYQEGKVAKDKLDEALAYLKFQPAAGDYEDAVAAELAPMLKRRYAQRIALTAAGEYSAASSATDKAFAETTKFIDKLKAVGEDKGETEDVDGVTLDDPRLGPMLSAMVLSEKLPWGVPEVDIALAGGISRGCTVLFLGSTGDGKTKAQIHAACTASRLGHQVAFATLEYSVTEVWRDIIANLSGFPVEKAATDNESARNLIKLTGVYRGVIYVKRFEPQRATLDDVLSWVERQCPDATVVIIDYLDKLTVPPVPGQREMIPYTAGLQLAEKFRLYCHDRELWGYSASQAQRRKDRKRLLDTDDTSMSLAKAQAGDYVITLNFDKELDALTYHLAKVRWGKGHQDVGPIEHDWGHGRMCKIAGPAGPKPEGATVLRLVPKVKKEDDDY